MCGLHCQHKAVPPLQRGTSPTGMMAVAWGHPGRGKPQLDGPNSMSWVYSLESKMLTRESKQPNPEMFAWLWSDPVWQWLVTALAQGGREGC